MTAPAEGFAPRRWLLPLAGFASVIAVWWLAIELFDIKPYIAPSPGRVLRTLVTSREMLLSNLGPTAIEALGGFVLGNVAAIVLAIVFVRFAPLKQAFLPVFAVLNAIPIVAKAPVLLLMLGNGAAPKIAIAGLVCFFPMLVNAVKGLESANPQSLELMRVLSASRFETFRHVRLYSALPHMFSGLRIAASMSVVGAVVGEWVGADAGLGALIIQAMFNFDSALLYAAIVMSSALAGLFYLLVGVAERFIIRWPPS